jgi:glycosyl transferase family 25
MKIIVINLSSAAARREFQEKQLGKLGLDYNFLNATSVDDIDDDTYQKHYYDWQRPLRRSEVACYFSHRRCWERVISSNEPALILEDDALLSSQIPSILKKLKTYNDIDLVDLEVTGRKKNVSKTSEVLHESSKLFKLYLNSSGAGGYVLYPSGAKKLLEREKKKGISLADAHIANCEALNAYQVEPAAVVQFILCAYYKINHSEARGFCTSSTNLEAKEKHNFHFRVKRFISEANLGIKKFILYFISERRFVFINKDNFDR